MFRPLATLTCVVLAAGTLFAPAAYAHDATIGPPIIGRSPEIAPSPASCVANVTDYGADPSGSADDTDAFRAAMTAALSDHPACFAKGPSGEPQAVVYVPAGTYRLANLYFPSNIRMEVDADATLQEPANRPSQPSDAGTPMLVWDARVAGMPPITNVTLIGVGSAMDDRKRAAVADGGAAIEPFDLSHDFTMNMDPASTGSTNYNPGLDMENVRYFRLQNVFSIQNNTNQDNTPITAWPTSSRAVVLLHARWNSPIKGHYIQPKDGTVKNQVNVNSPRGYGPNQVNAARRVKFANIYSSGGTALRLETDGSSNWTGKPDRGATVTQLSARHIVGYNCNRAVSLAPHAQKNGKVRVTGVWAYSCGEAVVAAIDQHVHDKRQGSFRDAKVAHVRVLGAEDAQLDSSKQLWVVGQSVKPAYVADGLHWSPHINIMAKAGSFTAGN